MSKRIGIPSPGDKGHSGELGKSRRAVMLQGSNAAEILRTFPIDKCPERGAKFIPKLAEVYITIWLQYDSTLEES
jgi:hypothetical protein